MYASIIKSAVLVAALAGTTAVSALPQAAQYPDKCGDMVCQPDTPLCCGVYYNGNIELECVAGKTCPPIQYPTKTTTTATPTPPATTTTSSTAPPASPTFGPKCGDSFFCKPGQVCCTLYKCADTPEQCPK
ncbi:hypothetical protein JDV02_005614 [Purpureocillium takamizusanense]|uniref:Uncharacterized protein n=1 Tax=Purpureocillium takamizusanense TaxID=2060973 RepID=A0A9Q8VAI4_9HYPO|nr:uncharacterized protein JDV02_005614 [Purpureocillium takamizusanense]UNI19430.1 hypothetical protein JDV02_005614 [Purpureocillium takamizusanense]